MKIFSFSKAQFEKMIHIFEFFEQLQLKSYI